MLSPNLSGPSQKPQTHTSPIWPRMLIKACRSCYYTPLRFSLPTSVIPIHGANSVLIYTFHQHRWASGWAKHWDKPEASKADRTLNLWKSPSTRRHRTVNSNNNWHKKYHLPWEHIVGPSILILGGMGGESGELSFAFFHSKFLYPKSSQLSPKYKSLVTKGAR